MLKEISIKGSMAYNDEDFSEVVQAFAQGKYAGVEKMVTSRIHLEDIAEKGFEELVKRKDDHIKILVTPKGVRRG
jgi:threonine dehydrogenase-like Zn-dependent dehydrogenase